MRKRGGDRSQPQHSTICCATHSAVGCRVTWTSSTSRLAWLTTKKAWRVLNHKVWTQKKSQAQISTGDFPMTSAFPTLFSPIRFRHKTLKNRLVFGAHT